MSEQSRQKVPTWPEVGVLFNDPLQDRKSLRIGVTIAIVIMGAHVAAAALYTGTGESSPLLLGTCAAVLLALLYISFAEIRKRRMVKRRAPIVAEAFGLDVQDFSEQMTALALPDLLTPLLVEGQLVWVMITEHRGKQIWTVYRQDTDGQLRALAVRGAGFTPVALHLPTRSEPATLHVSS